MGRGNFIPTASKVYKGFYVEYEGIYGEEYYNENDYDLQSMYYDDFIENLKCEFMEKFKSFFDPSKYSNNNWRANDERILLENNLCKLIVADNESSLAVYIVVDKYSQNENLAEKHIENYSKGLLEILKGILPEKSIRCRSSAWTSCLVY